MASGDLRVYQLDQRIGSDVHWGIMSQCPCVGKAPAPGELGVLHAPLMLRSRSPPCTVTFL